jgi:hypothetical protein
MNTQKKQEFQNQPTIKPNRQLRRKNAGINKYGLYKLKDGKTRLIVFGPNKYLHYEQIIAIKNEFGKIIGFRKVIHTRLVKS